MLSLLALTILLARPQRAVIIPPKEFGERHHENLVRRSGTRLRICNTGIGASGLRAARGSDPQHAGMERRTFRRRPAQSARRHPGPHEKRYPGRSLGDVTLRRL